MAAFGTGDRATDSSGRGRHSPNDGQAPQRGIGDRWFTAIDRWLAPILRRRAWKRLANTIAVFGREIEARGAGDQLDHIREALDGARKALASGDIDGGWRQFFLAHRLSLLDLDVTELSAVAAAMRAEADKLNPWRKKAVLDLLPTGEATDKDRLRKRVFQAALLRDEHYGNEAYKDGIRLVTALWLALALLIGLAALLCLADNGTLTRALADMPKSDNADLYSALLTVAVVGFLGAAMSALTTAPKSDAPSRIPEMVSSFRVIMMRLLVGPVSAIIVFFTVQSDTYSKIFGSNPDGYGLLVLAFVAGFTERLVRQVVETVAGKS